MAQSTLQRSKTTQVVENPEKLLIYLQSLQRVKLWYMECIKYSHNADAYFAGVNTFFALQERVEVYINGDLSKFDLRWLP